MGGKVEYSGYSTAISSHYRSTTEARSQHLEFRIVLLPYERCHWLMQLGRFRTWNWALTQHVLVKVAVLLRCTRTSVVDAEQDGLPRIKSTSRPSEHVSLQTPMDDDIVRAGVYPPFFAREQKGGERNIAAILPDHTTSRLLSFTFRLFPVPPHTVTSSSHWLPCPCRNFPCRRHLLPWRRHPSSHPCFRSQAPPSSPPSPPAAGGFGSCCRSGRGRR